MPRPIRPWFRFYVEAFPDRKIRRLKVAHRWIWVAVLGAARESPEPGKLYVAPGLPMTHRELADYAGVTEREVAAALLDMAAMTMVSVDAHGLISVTNWESRQFESDDVTQRTRSHRERSEEQVRNVPTNVPGNAPETETETETEKTSARGADSDRDFVAFWAAYPRRTDKGHAKKAWTKAVKLEKPSHIIAAAGHFSAKCNGTDPKFIPHPATWLNGERWSDEDPTQTAPPEESWMRRRPE